MIHLIKRHTKLFLKDKANVFFAFLSVFIIITLYLLFLAENMSMSLPVFDEREIFVFLWMFAGIIAVTTATASLGALGKFVEDKMDKKHEDFLMTKMTRQTFAYSYVFYTFFIGIIFTATIVIFGFIYSLINYNVTLDLSVSLLVIIMLSTLMHTLLFYLITSYLKTMNAFSGFSTIIGTLIGFLAGIYIPIGILPAYLQKVIILFPTTQPTILLRNLLMPDVLEPIKNMLPNEEYQEIIKTLGVKLTWNDYGLSTTFSWLYLIFFTLLLVIIVYFKNKKKINYF